MRSHLTFDIIIIFVMLIIVCKLNNPEASAATCKANVQQQPSLSIPSSPDYIDTSNIRVSSSSSVPTKLQNEGFAFVLMLTICVALFSAITLK
ncbi:hypothetical protein SAMD00019534_007600, partial [Acytostelium subglobosum LB1]|uniref:hypothetical protein n=1 Tax=Acytostelium subglobosum LB1 TaxID=1410327 RepID=UPI000644E588